MVPREHSCAVKQSLLQLAALPAWPLWRCDGCCLCVWPPHRLGTAVVVASLYYSTAAKRAEAAEKREGGNQSS